MSPLVLIGLALVASGIVLLGVALRPRLRSLRQRTGGRPAAQPQTVADLVRLRSESDSAEHTAASAQTAPVTAPPARVSQTPVPTPRRPEATPVRPTTVPVAAPGRVAAQRGAARRGVPTQVAAEPAALAASSLPTPAASPAAAVASVVQEPTAPEPPQPAPPVELDGDDDAPWRRAARIAAGLGDGRPWHDPAPAPPAPTEAAPLRLVRSAELAGPADVAVPVDGVTPSYGAAPVEHAAPEPEVSPELEVSPEPTAAVEPVLPAQTAEPVLSAAPAEPVEPAAPVEPVAGVGTAAPVQATEPAAPEQPVAPPSAAAPSAEWTAPPPVVQAAAAPAPEGEHRPEEASAAIPPSGPVEASAPADEPAQEPGFPTAAAAGALGLAAAGAAWVTARPQTDPEPAGAEAPPAEPAAVPPVAGPDPVGADARSPERGAVQPVAYEDWDDPDPEGVPAAAVPERFAEVDAAETAPEASDVPPPADGQQPPARRSLRTTDERAAEQAAADLALLRTFGFADPGMRPDQAPVVAMAQPADQARASATGQAQPVRYRAVHRDGSTVGGAAVTLLDDRGGDVADGTADAEGRGEVLAPAPGGYVLVSTAPGHLPGAVALTVSASPVEADVLLARAASISGAVRGEDGPVAGARVTLVQDGEAIDATDTDAEGDYRIGDIGAGEYGLSIAAPGCVPTASLIEVSEEAEVRHDVVLTPASPVAESETAVDDVMSGYR